MSEKTTIKCETCGATINLDLIKEDIQKPSSTSKERSIVDLVAIRIALLIGSLVAFWVVYTAAFHLGRAFDMPWLNVNSWPVREMVRSGAIVISLAALLNARKVVIFTIVGYISSVVLVLSVDTVRYEPEFGWYIDISPSLLSGVFFAIVIFGIILQVTLWSIKQYKKEAAEAKAEISARGQRETDTDNHRY